MPIMPAKSKQMTAAATPSHVSSQTHSILHQQVIDQHQQHHQQQQQQQMQPQQTHHQYQQVAQYNQHQHMLQQQQQQQQQHHHQQQQQQQQQIQHMDVGGAALNVASLPPLTGPLQHQQQQIPNLQHNQQQQQQQQQHIQHHLSTMIMDVNEAVASSSSASSNMLVQQQQQQQQEQQQQQQVLDSEIRFQTGEFLIHKATFSGDFDNYDIWYVLNNEYLQKYEPVLLSTGERCHQSADVVTKTLFY